MASGFSAGAASQRGISDLRSDVSVTSREMKWASGKPIGRSENVYVKSFLHLQLDCITSHPIKIAFFSEFGSTLILFVPKMIKTGSEERLEYLSKYS